MSRREFQLVKTLATDVSPRVFFCTSSSDYPETASRRDGDLIFDETLNTLLVSNQAGTLTTMASTLAGTVVRIAAGVPTGAPNLAIGELPLAFDSTASTGGLYVWNSAAWVKVSTIP